MGETQKHRIKGEIAVLLLSVAGSGASVSGTAVLTAAGLVAYGLRLAGYLGEERRAASAAAIECPAERARSERSEARGRQRGDRC